MQKHGGISRYFYELINGFNTVADIETKTPLLVSNNHYISGKKHFKHVDFLPTKHFRGKCRLFDFCNKPNTIFELKKQKFDLFHPTYYDPYFLKYLDKKPFVLTVYDMISEKFGEMFSSNDKTMQYKKKLVERATKIIAISENTKKDLIEIYGTDESKIEVIYLGNSMCHKTNTTMSVEVPSKYILFVGSREKYKNFDKFIKSVSMILNEDKELYVTCVGGGEFNTNEIRLFKALGISMQMLQHSVSDESLALFYKKAKLFVFPSLYEGFGIPVLESFACGCPLLCSNVSSLPEIAGDGAYYFDPCNKASISNAVKKVLYDENLQNKLVFNGTERLKKFSWEQTVIQTKRLYESIC
jgi:glycosyltransferase involved in cell wall biosynthesis